MLREARLDQFGLFGTDERSNRSPLTCNANPKTKRQKEKKGTSERVREGDGWCARHSQICFPDLSSPVVLLPSERHDPPNQPP